MTLLVDKRLRAEIVEMRRNPLPFANAVHREENLRVWDGVILGPVDSPYEGGTFSVKFEFGTDYPHLPPKVTFKTPIYHCNINTNGQICLNVLKMRSDKGSWSSGMGVSAILISLHQLLQEPNPLDPLMRSIADLYKESKVLHDENAREWTLKYAMPK